MTTGAPVRTASAAGRSSSSPNDVYGAIVAAGYPTESWTWSMRRSGDSDAIIAASAPTALAPVATATRAASAAVWARASRAVTACSRASRSAAPDALLRSTAAAPPSAPVDGYAAATGWVGKPLIAQFHHHCG